MTKFSYCSHCSQKIMVYRRNIRKGMIYGLIELWKKGECKSSELNIPIGINADFSKLRFWGLIYKPSLKREVWAITNKGKDFLTGLIEIPKYVFIFNNNVERYSSELVKLIDICPEKIDFDIITKHARPMITLKQDICEECEKPWNSEYHISDECINISEEYYNKVSPDLRKKSFGLGGRQK